MLVTEVIFPYIHYMCTCLSVFLYRKVWFSLQLILWDFSMYGIQRLNRKPIHMGSSKQEGVGALNKLDFDLKPRQVPVNTTVITSRPITERNSTPKTKKSSMESVLFVAPLSSDTLFMSLLVSFVTRAHRTVNSAIICELEQHVSSCQSDCTLYY